MWCKVCVCERVASAGAGVAVLPPCYSSLGLPDRLARSTLLPLLFSLFLQLFYSFFHYRICFCVIYDVLGCCLHPCCVSFSRNGSRCGGAVCLTGVVGVEVARLASLSLSLPSSCSLFLMQFSQFFLYRLCFFVPCIVLNCCLLFYCVLFSCIGSRYAGIRLSRSKVRFSTVGDR